MDSSQTEQMKNMSVEDRNLVNISSTTESIGALKGRLLFYILEFERNSTRVSRLESSLEKLKTENQNLKEQVSALEQSNIDLSNSLEKSKTGAHEYKEQVEEGRIRDRHELKKALSNYWEASSELAQKLEQISELGSSVSSLEKRLEEDERKYTLRIAELERDVRLRERQIELGRKSVEHALIRERQARTQMEKVSLEDGQIKDKLEAMETKSAEYGMRAEGTILRLKRQLSKIQLAREHGDLDNSSWDVDLTQSSMESLGQSGVTEAATDKPSLTKSALAAHRRQISSGTPVGTSPLSRVSKASISSQERLESLSEQVHYLSERNRVRSLENLRGELKKPPALSPLLKQT